MAKATIESAIAKGQGISSSGAALESLTIEAMLPNSVAIVIECQTDQKARVLQDVRHLIKDAGGTATPTSFLFEKKGRIVFEKQSDPLNVDDHLDQAIDAGATDLDSDGEGRLALYTEHTSTKSVADTFSHVTGLKPESVDIIWDPNKDTLVPIDSEEAAQALDDAIASIREDPSVQEIYSNSIRT